VVDDFAAIGVNDEIVRNARQREIGFQFQAEIE
jgi:hypothetical protein